MAELISLRPEVAAGHGHGPDLPPPPGRAQTEVWSRADDELTRSQDAIAKREEAKVPKKAKPKKES